MESLDEVLLECEDKMEKSLDVLRKQFQGLRTGKASPSLVENVTVQYYGAPTRLRELANITTPELRLLVISPYDPSAIHEIEKAILAANLGVTPVSDGRVVRVPVPELSEERRKELIKVAHRLAEENRVAVRNIRREANEQAKHLQKDKAATEDERDAALESIQKLTDEMIGKIDDAVKAKEAEVMEV